MNLKEKIASDQKSALKSGDAIRLSALRMLWAAISNKEIDLRKKDIGLSDQEILDVVTYEAKKRKDAIFEYQKGGRQELADKEERELQTLQEYLPPEISEEELVRIIKNGIRETGAVSDKDFGKAMKAVMPYLKGKASGDRISKTLKNELEKKHD